MLIALLPDYEVGKSYDMIYGPSSLGINPLTGYPVFLVKGNKEKQASEALTAEDVVALGHSTPPYSGSFGLSLSYKSFDLDMDFYYVHGGIRMCVIKMIQIKMLLLDKQIKCGLNREMKVKFIRLLFTHLL